MRSVLLVVSCLVLGCMACHTSAADSARQGDEVVIFYEKHPLAFCGIEDDPSKGIKVALGKNEFVYVSKKPDLTIDDVDDVGIGLHLGEKTLVVYFSTEGAIKNENFTTKNKWKQIVILSYGHVICAPKVIYPSKKSSVISGGEAIELYEKFKTVIHERKIP